MKRIALTLAVILVTAAAGCTGNRDEALRHYGLGHLAFERGDLDAALEEFETAVTIDDLAVAYAGVGDVLREKGDLEGAVRPYKKAIKLMPQEFTYRYRLGYVYQGLERHEDAAEIYETAVDIDPDNVPVRVNLGVVYFRIAMEETDDRERNEALAKAREHGETGIELDPTHGHGWATLGSVYDAQGKAYEAIRAYKKALELDPDQAPVRVNLGTVYLRQGRLQEAMAQFRQASKLAPEMVRINRQLGLLYSRKKEYRAALEEYQVVLDENPDDWDVRNRVAAIHMLLFLRNPRQDQLRQDALAQWHKSLEIHPDQAQIRATVRMWSNEEKVQKLADRAEPETTLEDGPETAASGGNGTEATDETEANKEVEASDAAEEKKATNEDSSPGAEKATADDAGASEATDGDS